MTAKKVDLTLAEIMLAHEAFRPLLASKLLTQKLDEITANKKSVDEEQRARLELAVSLLKSGITLPAYPDKTYESLVAQMVKQLKKINKKLAKAAALTADGASEDTVEADEANAANTNNAENTNTAT